MESKPTKNPDATGGTGSLAIEGLTPRQFFVGLLLGVGFVVFLGCLGGAMLNPDSSYRQQQAAHKQQLADKLLAAVQKALPDDATDVTPLKSEYPYGWLTFVRSENGKRVKFLVWYKRDPSSYTEPLVSIVRAD